jgi:hypothetical protein
MALKVNELRRNEADEGVSSRPFPGPDLVLGDAELPHPFLGTGFGHALTLGRAATGSPLRLKAGSKSNTGEIGASPTFM